MSQWHENCCIVKVASLIDFQYVLFYKISLQPAFAGVCCILIGYTCCSDSSLQLLQVIHIGSIIDSKTLFSGASAVERY